MRSCWAWSGTSNRTHARVGRQRPQHARATRGAHGGQRLLRVTWVRNSLLRSCSFAARLHEALGACSRPNTSCTRTKTTAKPLNPREQWRCSHATPTTLSRPSSSPHDAALVLLHAPLGKCCGGPVPLHDKPQDRQLQLSHSQARASSSTAECKRHNLLRRSGRPGASETPATTICPNGGS